jgi:hypothetical protein
MLVEASCVVDSPLLAVDLRSAGGKGSISARVSGDVVGMAEAATRQNKVLELDPHLGKATCGGAGELLA